VNNLEKVNEYASVGEVTIKDMGCAVNEWRTFQTGQQVLPKVSKAIT
jgi:hypothetical protein